LSRPYGTAIFAVVLASLVTGIADAKSNSAVSSPVVATALPSGSQRVSDDADRIAPAPASETYTVSPQVQQELRARDDVTPPSATAEVKMWSEATAAPAETEPSAPSAAAKKADPIRRFARGILSRTSSIAMSLTRSAMRFIGTPYVFGGTSPSGFDCSGYTQHVFAMLGITLPRTADAQYGAGHPVVGGMTTGDLVFFQTYEPGPSHVGIYVGSGRFIHSSSHGVMISRLGDSYWRSRYIGAKRIAALQ